MTEEGGRVGKGRRGRDTVSGLLDRLANRKWRNRDFGR